MRYVDDEDRDKSSSDSNVGSFCRAPCFGFDGKPYHNEAGHGNADHYPYACNNKEEEDREAEVGVKGSIGIIILHRFAVCWKRISN